MLFPVLCRRSLKLFDKFFDKAFLLWETTPWWDTPAKRWGSLGGFLLLLMVLLPLPDFVSLMVVVGAIAGVLTLWKPWESRIATASSESKVIDLRQYRQRRQQPETAPQSEGLKPVLETNFLPQADLVQALLEENGIPAHVLNRHNASILVHPLGSQTVKVVVPASLHARAIRLLEQSAPRPPRNSPDIA